MGIADVCMSALEWSCASVPWLILKDSVSEGPGKTDRALLGWGRPWFYSYPQYEDHEFRKAMWCGAMWSVDHPMSESCGHHCQEAEAWRGESNSELWECQWNFQRGFNGGPEEKDRCRQEKVLIVNCFLSLQKIKQQSSFRYLRYPLYVVKV